VVTQAGSRRERGGDRAGRHRGAEQRDRFEPGFSALGHLAYEGASVSAAVVDLGTGTTLVSIDDRVALPIGDVGRILLLIEVSARISSDSASGLELLERSTVEAIDGPGLWRRLRVPSLPVTDLAALVGATGDALATNVLLQRVGLDAVRARTDSLGLRRTALLDRVRMQRGPDDAPQLAVGSAAELTWLLTALSRGQVVDAPTSRRVLGWLAGGSDQSMVASAFGLDPMDHALADHGIRLANTTGSDAGVRSDIGVLTGPRAAVAYAVSVQFADTSLTTRLAVLEAMRVVGTDLLEYVA